MSQEIERGAPDEAGGGFTRPEAERSTVRWQNTSPSDGLKFPDRILTDEFPNYASAGPMDTRVVHTSQAFLAEMKALGSPDVMTIEEYLERYRPTKKD